MEAAIAPLKSGKSAGPDGIPPDVYKRCDLKEAILEFCNAALTGKGRPQQWALSHIIPVPKSGSLNTPDNYRGISLTCIMAKIFNRLILNRIRKAIDPKLRFNQNGFWQKQSTAASLGIAKNHRGST